MVCKSGSNSTLGQVIGTTPPYDPSDEAWTTLQKLAKQLGIGRAMLDRIRTQFGHRFEHSTGSGRAARIYIYAPLWLPEWAAWKCDPRRVNGKPAAGIDHKDRKERANADKAELEVEKLRGELVHVGDVRYGLMRIADKLRDKLGLLGRFSTEAQRIMVDALDELAKEGDSIFEANGYSHDQTTDGEA